ncbi:hypothetical protein TNCV_1387411 [Trichonephila clavipes]|nr:hypothetical protein TNCV_1387411 [Trichonephila clavipes]
MNSSSFNASSSVEYAYEFMSIGNMEPPPLPYFDMLRNYTENSKGENLEYRIRTTTHHCTLQLTAINYTSVLNSLQNIFRYCACCSGKRLDDLRNYGSSIRAPRNMGGFTGHLTDSLKRI